METVTSADPPGDPLPADTIAVGDLIAPAVRGAGELRASLRVGRPLPYPVPADDLPPPWRLRARAGRRYLGVVFAFDVTALPPGLRLTWVRLTVRLGGDALAAVVHADGGALGVVPGSDGGSPLGARAVAAADRRPDLLRRLGLRADRPRAAVSGAQSPCFGWTWQGRGLTGAYGTHVLVEAPAALTSLTGSLEVEADLTGVARRRLSQAARVTFDEPLQPGGTGAAVRLCMAADVIGYSTRPDDETAALQRDLVRVLAGARRAAGVAPEEVAPQPQGDGQFTVLPLGIDEAAVIPRLVAGIGAGLAGTPRMRLRVALHRGLVRAADNGWVGRAAIAVHRLLDSPPLHAAARDNPAARFVLGVPDVLYEDVLRTSAGPPAPREWVPMEVSLPEKGFTERGWWWAAR